MKTLYKHQLYMGMIGDMKNLEHHFSLMAEQGWMLDKIGLLTHRYRAIEPCDKRFFIDLLPQITAFDYPENEDAQDYRRLCEESGWTFVAANKQFHVFCTDNADTVPVPIHTDNKIQAKIFLKACRKYELPWFIYALVMLYFFSTLGKGFDIFLSNIMLFMTIGYGFFLIGFLWNFGFMIRWYWRVRKAAKNDSPLPIVHYQLARWRMKAFAAGIILFMVCVVLGGVFEIINGMPVMLLFTVILPILGVGVGLWLRRQIDTKKRTRGSNIRLSIITFVVMELVILTAMGFVVRGLINTSFYRYSLGDRPVLTLADVGITSAPNSNSTIIRGTPAVPLCYEHWASNRQGSVNTEVMRTINTALTKALYERSSADFTKAHNHSPGMAEKITLLNSHDAAYWGAEEGMAFFFEDTNRVDLLLRSGKIILRLSFDGEYTSLASVRQAILDLWRDLEIA